MIHKLFASAFTVKWTRLVAIAVCALGVMAFDSCNDDPLLDSSGGTGCAGSHCSARILPDSTVNPAAF